MVKGAVGFDVEKDGPGEALGVYFILDHSFQGQADQFGEEVKVEEIAVKGVVLSTTRLIFFSRARILWE